MEGTWAKLKDDSWGARVVSAHKPNTGDALTVKKKDGTASQVTITAITWSAGGVHLCKVNSASSSGSNSRSQGRSRGPWTGCSCGSVEEYAKSSDCRSCRHDRD